VAFWVRKERESSLVVANEIVKVAKVVKVVTLHEEFADTAKVQAGTCYCKRRHEVESHRMGVLTVQCRTVENRKVEGLTLDVESGSTSSGQQAVTAEPKPPVLTNAFAGMTVKKRKQYLKKVKGRGVISRYTQGRIDTGVWVSTSKMEAYRTGVKKVQDALKNKLQVTRDLMVYDEKTICLYVTKTLGDSSSGSDSGSDSGG